MSKKKTKKVAKKKTRKKAAKAKKSAQPKRPSWDPKGEYDPNAQPKDPDHKPWITKSLIPEDPSEELTKLRERVVKHAKAFIKNVAPLMMKSIKLEEERDPRESLPVFFEQAIFYANKIIERVNRDDSLYRRVICPACKGRILLEPTRNEDGSIKRSNKCTHCFAGFMPQAEAEKLQETLNDGSTNTD